MFPVGTSDQQGVPKMIDDLHVLINVGAKVVWIHAPENGD
jgi:hypothetical protein